MEEQPSSHSGLGNTGSAAVGGGARSLPTNAPAGIPPAGAHRSCLRRGLGCLLQVLGLLMLAAIVAAAVGVAGFWWWAHHGSALAGEAHVVNFEVRAGDSLTTIARRLDQAGVARPWPCVAALALGLRLDRGIPPGHYALDPGLPPVEVLRHLAAARARPAREEVRVTLPEGWTTLQMADRLAQRGVIADRERFLTLCGDADFLHALGVPADDAQGYLFPDTYFFQPHTDEAEVVRRLVTQFRAVVLGTGTGQLGLLPGQNSPNAQPLTFAEAVTLASILEREARLAEEMPRIASVYHNRLAKKMNLESCATVRFALDKWRAPLTLADLKDESPYNTYRRAGLPPGPICNPGREALAAAFRPERTDFLFYVYRGDNHHEFTRTYEEHMAARQRFKDAWAQPIVRAADAAGAADAANTGAAGSTGGASSANGASAATTSATASVPPAVAR